ncbi:pyrimidine dimer DNA glycosylase/endonuclease V [Alkalibacillus sp. S2W]|uniref:pyrimidine dimer DNA glycosylase/endonuclease V n=1 Tax=Alkalibacillus sp. S2W TaxID=3386553 RepID=UPI00398C83D4
MRVWSIHPKYLDAKGLVALWRETLLAQKVLKGETKGYRNHPQLVRFRDQKNPLQAIGTYLQYVYDEAVQRGYNFDQSKIYDIDQSLHLNVTKGQIEYEWHHLLTKLEVRDPERFESLKGMKHESIEAHPLFSIVEGELENWERVTKK